MANHKTRIEQLEKAMIPPAGEFCACGRLSGGDMNIHVELYDGDPPPPTICPKCGKPIEQIVVTLESIQEVDL